jgi:hypothetical protein
MRSQFSANAKATMPLEDVAELMGHTDPTHRTTQLNYGPRRAAHSGAVGLREQSQSAQIATHPDRPDESPGLSENAGASGPG